MSNKTKKFGDPRKRTANHSKVKNESKSTFDDAMKLNGDIYTFLHSTLETTKKCNHVEVSIVDENIMLFELVKFKDHIEIDNGFSTRKYKLEEWDNWIDFMDKRYRQQRNCVFHSMFFKDENKLREFFKTKTDILPFEIFKIKKTI